jgi:hypothetical protein
MTKVDWPGRLERLSRALGWSRRETGFHLARSASTVAAILGRRVGVSPVVASRIMTLEGFYARELERFEREGRPQKPPGLSRPEDLAEMGRVGTLGTRGGVGRKANPDPKPAS